MWWKSESDSKFGIWTFTIYPKPHHMYATTKADVWQPYTEYTSMYCIYLFWLQIVTSFLPSVNIWKVYFCCYKFFSFHDEPKANVTPECRTHIFIRVWNIHVINFLSLSFPFLLPFTTVNPEVVIVIFCLFVLWQLFFFEDGFPFDSIRVVFVSILGTIWLKAESWKASSHSI